MAALVRTQAAADVAENELVQADALLSRTLSQLSVHTLREAHHQAAAQLT